VAHLGHKSSGDLRNSLKYISFSAIYVNCGYIYVKPTNILVSYSPNKLGFF
jgi:hypothetical protein